MAKNYQALEDVEVSKGFPPTVSSVDELDSLPPGTVAIAYDTPWIKLSRGAGLWQSIDGVEEARELLFDGPIPLVWPITVRQFT